MNEQKQDFIKNWNSTSPEERKNLLREIEWKPGEISQGRYDKQAIEEMSHLGIGTDKRQLNGTIARDLVKRALESKERALEPKIKTPPEGCLPRLFGARR